MGHHYDRLDLTAEESSSGGITINPGPLVAALTRMVRAVIAQPTCLLPEVVRDVYFEAKE